MKNLKALFMKFLFYGSISKSFAQINVTGYFVGNFGTHYCLW